MPGPQAQAAHLSQALSPGPHQAAPRTQLHFWWAQGQAGWPGLAGWGGTGAAAQIQSPGFYRSPSGSHHTRWGTRKINVAQDKAECPGDIANLHQGI